MGAAAWFLRRRRGVATIVALPLGAVLAATVAWQLGQLLGSGPSAAELEEVGSQVTTSLTLGSLPALAVAPFTAIAAYLVAVLYAPDDGLGRSEPDVDRPVTPEYEAGQAVPDESDLPEERPLPEGPQPGRSSA
jgi:hypothetical protein